MIWAANRSGFCLRNTRHSVTPGWSGIRKLPANGVDLGAGGRRHLPLPVDQAGHQLLRAVQCREELGRQDDDGAFKPPPLIGELALQVSVEVMNSPSVLFP